MIPAKNESSELYRAGYLSRLFHICKNSEPVESGPARRWILRELSTLLGTAQRQHEERRDGDHDEQIGGEHRNVASDRIKDKVGDGRSQRKTSCVDGTDNA